MGRPSTRPTAWGVAVVVAVAEADEEGADWISDQVHLVLKFVIEQVNEFFYQVWYTILSRVLVKIW